MDFMSDCLFEVRPFRILIVVDCHTREALALTLRANFRAYQLTGPWTPWSGCGVGPLDPLSANRIVILSGCGRSTASARVEGEQDDMGN